MTRQVCPFARLRRPQLGCTAKFFEQAAHARIVFLKPFDAGDLRCIEHRKQRGPFRAKLIGYRLRRHTIVAKAIYTFTRLRARTHGELVHSHVYAAPLADTSLITPRVLEYSERARALLQSKTPKRGLERLYLLSCNP